MKVGYIYLKMYSVFLTFTVTVFQWWKLTTEVKITFT